MKDAVLGHLSHVLHSVNVIADHCGMMNQGIERNDRALVERGCLGAANAIEFCEDALLRIRIALDAESLQRVPGLQPDGHLGAVEP